MLSIKRLFLPSRGIVIIGVPLMLLLLFWLVSYVRRKPLWIDDDTNKIKSYSTFQTLEPVAVIGDNVVEVDTDLSSNEVVEPDDYPHVDGVKIILFYVPFFNRADYYFGLGRQPFLDAHCPMNRCETTNDRQRFEESDAVIFHPFDMKLNKDPLPKRSHSRRTRHQRWIFHVSESADNTNLDWEKWNGLFNWTTCFRTDCDIHHPYMRTIAKKKTETTTTVKVTTSTSAVRRRRLVSWLVSNCATEGRREEYVAELKKHIDVDVFGRCGRPCDKACSERVFEDYKFYLAFENSVCKDYVTEKLLNPLQHRRIVPVVYGGANYGTIAPPHSVIDVRDFESPKHLADYLRMLDSNDTLYERYFDWKANYEVKYVLPFCELCAKLHEEEPDDGKTSMGVKTKVYDDLREWYVNRAECRHDILGMP